jgi:hypothetical protein
MKKAARKAEEYMVRRSAEGRHQMAQHEKMARSGKT